MAPPISLESEMLLHYDRFYETEENEARKKQYLKRNVLPLLNDVGRERKVIEIGPGHGSLLELLRQEGFVDIAGFDVCDAFVDKLRAKGFSIELGKSAVDYLKCYTDGQVEVVLLVDVLEHLPMDEVLLLLSETRRVLAPNGRVIIQCPNSSGLFGMNTFVADPTHLTLWNEIRLTSVLNGCGFKKVRCFPLALPPGIGNIIRGIAREALYHLVRFVTKVCGAPGVQILTHNVVCEAR